MDWPTAALACWSGVYWFKCLLDTGVIRLGRRRSNGYNWGLVEKSWKNPYEEPPSTSLYPPPLPPQLGRELEHDKLKTKYDVLRRNYERLKQDNIALSQEVDKWHRQADPRWESNPWPD